MAKKPGITHVSPIFICTLSILILPALALQLRIKNGWRSQSNTNLFSIKEIDRRLGYEQRNYTWPIPLEMHRPPTSGWQKLFARRFEQISKLSSADHNKITNKYNGWVSAVTSAVVLQNFTEYGWGLTRAPDDLVNELREELLNGVEKGEAGGGMRLEKEIEIIVKDKENTDVGEALPAMFVDLPQHLKERALSELLPIHNEFGNVTLSPNGVCYGLRLYRNNSRLLMHSDNPKTRIIASILHLGRSEDAEDWPLVLEDFYGNTYEVALEVGDMLLYESAKIYHGRPKKFSGSWYCSLLNHYYPVNWDTENFHWEGHYAVPPHWFEDPVDNQNSEACKIDRLEVVGTGLKEPDCEHGWRAIENAIKIHGPAKSDIIMSPKDLL